MKNTKVLIVGIGGYMGLFYTKVILEDTQLQAQNITGVEIDPKNREKVSSKFPQISNLTNNLDQALANQDYDIAIILTNSVTHKDIIIACHGAGIKNIFVEKPLVYTSEELYGLHDIDTSKLITAYLINFSKIVQDLFIFMEEGDLIVIEALSCWGKNWCAENRPMGGDAEEELPHPLALILSTIATTQTIEKIESNIFMSHEQFVRPELLEDAKSTGTHYPTEMNDSTISALQVKTKSKEVSVFIMSSFNFFDQRRWVEFILCKKESDRFPLYKCRLIFDEGGKDTLQIIKAKTGEIIYNGRYSENKLAEQLMAVIRYYTEGQKDQRLVDFDQSKRLVQIIHRANF